MEALELDPLYGDAYAVLAQLYQGFAWYGHMPAHEAFAKAETAARKAVALDSASGLGHATLAATLSFYRYQWAAGEEEFRKAMTLDPDDAYIRNLMTFTANVVRTDSQPDVNLIADRLQAVTDRAR